ncbi:MAG: hypothetical protein MGU50_04245 [Trichodesmium sp. MAG_R02]|nr:hypothetical protein [Trichodesmium sp. MAG_R02]
MFTCVQNLTAFWDGCLELVVDGQEYRSGFIVFELSQPIWDCYIAFDE